jgi:hypothetical protein
MHRKPPGFAMGLNLTNLQSGHNLGPPPKPIEAKHGKIERIGEGRQN